MSSLGVSHNSLITRKAVLNGRIETIEKFSDNNFSSINSLKDGSTSKNQQYSVSKFGGNSSNNISKSSPKKSNHKKDMHKQVIMKSIMSKGEEYYDNLSNNKMKSDDEKKKKN